MRTFQILAHASRCVRAGVGTGRTDSLRSRMVLLLALVATSPAWAQDDGATGSAAGFWRQVWGTDYVHGHSGMIVEGEQVVVEVLVDISNDVCEDSIEYLQQGEYLPAYVTEIPNSSLTGPEARAQSLKSLVHYLVAATITGPSGKRASILGVEARMEDAVGTVTRLVTPVTVEASLADAITSAFVAEAMLDGTEQPAPSGPPGPPPPPPGEVNCFCSQCYLDCTDDCDDDYDICVSGCNAIHTACMAGAATVYAWCIGSCNCAGLPGLGCSCRCFACGVNRRIEEAACWAARIGCLTGCELGKTACYSGCWIGSWQSFPNPPGCPEGWTQNP